MDRALEERREYSPGGKVATQFTISFTKCLIEEAAYLMLEDFWDWAGDDAGLGGCGGGGESCCREPRVKGADGGGGGCWSSWGEGGGRDRLWAGGGGIGAMWEWWSGVGGGVVVWWWGGARI